MEEALTIRNGMTEIDPQWSFKAEAAKVGFLIGNRTLGGIRPRDRLWHHAVELRSSCIRLRAQVESACAVNMTSSREAVETTAS